MAQIQITFDDSRERNLAKLLGTYLENPNIVYQNNGQDTFNYGRISPNDASFAKVQSDLQNSLTENGRLESENKNLKEKIDSLKLTLEERDKQIEKDKSALKELEDLVNESDNKLKLKDQELKNISSTYDLQIKDIREDCDKQLKNLNSRIKELSSHLEYYMPTGLTEENEEIYFRVAGKNLIQTKSYDAPYKGITGKNGKIAFQFNIEKGRIQDAIAKKEVEIEPFCEILNDIPEGANVILLDQWGEGQLESEDYLIVNKRAKIKIIRG